MKSLLISEGIITLKKIRESFMCSMNEIGISDDIIIVPNGTYNNDYHKYQICNAFAPGDYSDSVILRVKDIEYPMYFGGNSFGSNPLYLTYGKKIEDSFILLQEVFSNRDLYDDNPNLAYSFFITAEINNVNGSLINLKEKKLYDYTDDEDLKKKIRWSVIEKSNLDAINECVSVYNALFKKEENIRKLILK